MKKNIIVRQQDLKDCGVCCMLSIIKYYNGYIPLEKLRVDTQTSLEGTNAYQIVKAATNYGFDAYGIKLESIKDLETIILPAISHVVVNNLNHFVVIYKITKTNCLIMDPARGKVKISKEEFEQLWTKNIIVLYPQHKLPNISNENHLLQILFGVLKKERKLILKIMYLTFFFTLLTILTGFYFKIGANMLNQNEDKNAMTILIILFFFLLITKFLIHYLRNYFKNILNKNIDGYMYYNFLKHLFSLPNYFIKGRTTGEIMIRIKELENVKEVFSEIIITVFLDSILAFSVGMILWNINKILFSLLCFFIFIYGICGIITGKVLYKKALRTNESEIDFQSKVIENIDSMITIKNLNIIKLIFKKIEVHLFKYLSNVYDLNKIAINTNIINFIIEEFLTFSIISIGFLEIIKENLTIVDLITFESLVSFFIAPFKNMINLIPNYNYVKVEITKINDFYNVPEEQEKIGYHEFKNGDIEIEKLTFSYNSYVKLFENLNMLIKENDFVLFKGNSGCGKSTLCQMISRLIEVKNNNIKIRNVSINDYSLETIRKNITYVSQKENLIQDTIKNNILLNRNIKEEDFKKIVELCEIESIVAKKPLRYETFLQKDAINLSGGEKQRIILARALLNPFQILILDEALSEINNELEIKLIKNLKIFFQNKTIIYVSHKNHEKYFDKVYDFGKLNDS